MGSLHAINSAIGKVISPGYQVNIIGLIFSRIPSIRANLQLQFEVNRSR